MPQGVLQERPRQGASCAFFDLLSFSRLPMCAPCFLLRHNILNVLWETLKDPMGSSLRVPRTGYCPVSKRHSMPQTQGVLQERPRQGASCAFFYLLSFSPIPMCAPCFLLRHIILNVLWETDSLPKCKFFFFGCAFHGMNEPAPFFVFVMKLSGTKN